MSSWKFSPRRMVEGREGALVVWLGGRGCRWFAWEDGGRRRRLRGRRLCRGGRGGILDGKFRPVLPPAVLR